MGWGISCIEVTALLKYYYGLGALKVGIAIDDDAICF